MHNPYTEAISLINPLMHALANEAAIKEQKKRACPVCTKLNAAGKLTCFYCKGTGLLPSKRNKKHE